MPYEITVMVAEEEDGRRVKSRAREEAVRRRQTVDIRPPRQAEELQPRAIWYQRANSTEVRRGIVYTQAGQHKLMQTESGTMLMGTPSGWQQAEDPDAWSSLQNLMWWTGLTPADQERIRRFLAGAGEEVPY
jgi:hypothetical protein